MADIVEDREQRLTTFICDELPEFAKLCASDLEYVVLHQDAFAADYQDKEFYLLGAAVKYAGLKGKEVRVIGKNRDTVAI